MGTEEQNTVRRENQRSQVAFPKEQEAASIKVGIRKIKGERGPGGVPQGNTGAEFPTRKKGPKSQSLLTPERGPGQSQVEYWLTRIQGTVAKKKRQERNGFGKPSKGRDACEV